VFAGRHEGFPGATHHRRLEFDGPAGTLAIRDTVHGGDGRELEWTFPLPPGARAELTAGGAAATIGDARLAIAADGLAFSVEEGWYAPVYGRREPAPFVRARRVARGDEDVQLITITTSAQ
jgi:hypothetical protein